MLLESTTHASTWFLPLPCSGSTIVVSSSAPAAESPLVSSDEERLPGSVSIRILVYFNAGTRTRTRKARPPMDMMTVERHLEIFS
jgi:hypothetical protein